MEIKWDTEKVLNLLRTFSSVSGININIVLGENVIDDTLYTRAKKPKFCKEIQKTKKGAMRCAKSDKCLFEKCKNSTSAESHLCHAGLIDIAMPIVFNDETLAYTILGQIRTNDDFSAVKEKIKDLGTDEKKMAEYYKELALFDYEKIQSVRALAEIFSKYLIMENIFFSENISPLDKACTYINEHLSEKLSIEEISKNVHLSRSTLYKVFSEKYNCTPGEYINKTRISKSLEMILYSEYNIEEISERVGFSSLSYFSKIFKKIHGSSPLSYRKKHKSRL